MKTLANLDMNRIFDETEAAVRARAQQILAESKEERANPELAASRQSERDTAREQEAQRIVDSVPALIAARIANGEQSLILMTVELGNIWGYNVSPARIIEEAVVEHNKAVAALVIEKLSGIDKLFVKRVDYKKANSHVGGFFVCLNW